MARTGSGPAPHSFRAVSVNSTASIWLAPCGPALAPAAAEAYQACIHGQWASLAPLWRRALKASGGGRAAELIRQQRAYLQGQAESLLITATGCLPGPSAAAWAPLRAMATSSSRTASPSAA